MSFGAYSEANGMAAPAVRSRADLSFAVGCLCELELDFFLLLIRFFA
jgi:hypothetical protein